MSDINSQNQNNIIASLKEPIIGTKNSLEQINKYLQEIHKNVLKESSPKNEIESIVDKKEPNDKKKDNKEDNIIEEKKECIEGIDENKDKKLNNKENVHSIADSELNDNTEEVSNININKIKNTNNYKVSNDINIINSIGIKKHSIFKKKDNDDISQKTENDKNNIINDNKKEEKKNKNKEYVYKEKDEITESSINPE